MGEQRQYENVRQPYTEKQIEEMKESLIQAVGEVRTLRTEKTAAMSSMGAAVKSAEKRVFELQEKLSLGYEIIETEVFFDFDKPEPGLKKVVRLDNGEVLRTEQMTPRERQQSFGFGISGEDPRPEK